MQRWFGKVLEDKDEIELLQSELNTFQRRNFDFAQSGHKERRIGEMNETLRRWLQTDICAMRHTFE